ncbi:MAG: TonB-dependent receptor [Cellvibrionaceae bacterium]|nr:TonB-dependent receptor [Cellvibrionaceae bacterium]
MSLPSFSPRLLPLALASIIAASSQAQIIEENIIVTATRTERAVDGVTASVEVLTAAEIEAMGAQTLKDVFNNTPGLIVQYGTFPAASSASKASVSLRGLGATGTLWLLDGRRLAGEVKNPYDMDRIPAAIVERIEIVKGPMSALYGADALGGVINIITKRPDDELRGGVSIRHGANSDGDAEQSQADAHVRGSLGESARFSLYGSYQHNTPYTELEHTDTRIGGGRHSPSGIPAVPGFLNPNGPSGGKPFYFHGPGQVRPQPLDPSKLGSDRQAAQQSFDNFRQQAGGIADSYAVPVSYREAAEVSTLGGRFEWDLNQNLRLGVDANWFDEERSGVYHSAFHPTGFVPPGGFKANPIVGHKPNGQPIFFADAKGTALGAIPAWDVPVRSRDNNERLDLAVDLLWQAADTLTVNGRAYLSDYEKQNTTTITEYADFGYASEAASSASGMNANVEIQGFESWASWALHPAHLLTAGIEYRDEEREATVFKNAKPGEDPFDTRSVSYRVAYIQDEWEVNDQLNITAGARWDEYRQESYTDALGQNRPEQKESEVTLRLGAVQNFNEQFNLRAVYAQGFRVPDIRELFIQKRTPAGFQLGAQAIEPTIGKGAHELGPESVDAYELSVFGQLDSVRYELTAFYNDIEDRIEQLAVDANNDGSDDYFSFYNIADAKTSGLELNLGWQATDSVQVDFFWTEISTENKANGRDLDYTPERQLSLAAQWQASQELSINTRINHIGEQQYSLNKQPRSSDAYTLVNANFAYQLSQSMELFGGVDNIFDEEVEKRLGSNPGTTFYLGLRVEM